MEDSTTGEYSLDRVYKGFSNVIDPSDQQSIRLHEFISAFRELAKFFDHLNVVFTFVARDLVDKFDLLGYLHRRDPINYHSVQTMLAHEKAGDDKTGIIALLRLLRALEFTYLFLQRAVVSPIDSSSTKHVAWDVYKQTLHKRHQKAARWGIWVATATIPKRESLRQTLVRGEIEPQTPEKCFPLIEKIYRDIHKLYEDNNFLEFVPL